MMMMERRERKLRALPPGLVKRKSAFLRDINERPAQLHPLQIINDLFHLIVAKTGCHSGHY